MASVPPSVGVLGVGRVTALKRGVTPLAPPPPRRAPGGRASAVSTPSPASRGGLSRLAPAGGAVELMLSQQAGLDAGGAGSQQPELLQRDKDQQRKKKKKKGEGETAR